MEASSFSELLDTVSTGPGVYMFKDSEGRVLYVGKAGSLKSRLRSYTPGPSAPAKAVYLVAKSAGVETIVTRTELEALMLEYTLIQKYRPRQNVIWRDNKSYPYLEISMSDPFPRLYLVRRTRRAGGRQFGPFTARTARQLARMVNRQFRIPSCRVPMDGKQVPCLYHHLDWCDAPCAGHISSERYAGLIRQARMFLEGRRAELVRELEAEMNASAEREEFEQAARLRDRMKAVREVLEDQAVVDPDGGDMDVLAVARSGSFACLALLSIRSGKLQGKQEFVVRGVKDEGDGDLIATFLEQHYGSPGVASNPDGGVREASAARLILPCLPTGEEMLRTWQAERRGGAVVFEYPKRGRGRELLDLAEANARAALVSQGRVDEEEAREQVEAAARELGLDSLPDHIEAVDLSRLGGEEAVAAVVVFRGGQPSTREYRRFMVKEAPSDDDYAGMCEVVGRRIRHLVEAGESLPDLLLLDGGAGHLAAVEGMLAGASARPRGIAALAKREELLFVSGRPGPLRLPSGDPVLLLLMRARDEAHRFAGAYQRKRRSMTMRADASAAAKSRMGGGASA